MLDNSTQRSRGGIAPSPIAPIDDTDAALYFGHLAAQAEIALPKTAREEQVAATWIAAHVASISVRYWRASFEAITIAGRDIGSWSLVARSAKCPKKSLEIARRPWLIEDGRQIMALAHPFLDPEKPDTSTEAGLQRLLDYASLQTISALSRTRSRIVIRDSLGTEVTLSAARTGIVKKKIETFLRAKSEA